MSSDNDVSNIRISCTKCDYRQTKKFDPPMNYLKFQAWALDLKCPECGLALEQRPPLIEAATEAIMRKHQVHHNRRK